MITVTTRELARLFILLCGGALTLGGVTELTLYHLSALPWICLTVAGFGIVWFVQKRTLQQRSGRKR